MNNVDKNQLARKESFVCQLEQMLAYGSSFVDAKVGSLEISTKNILTNFLVQISSAFFGIMLFLIAAAFFMYGIAMAIGTVLGAGLGFGFIITGGGLILGKLFFSKLVLNQKIKKSKNESEALIQKAAEAKSAFLKANENLKSDIAEALDITKLTQEYPYYSMGIAGAVGFVSAFSFTSQTVKETEVVKTTSEKSGLTTMLTNLAENILKESVIPLVKEQFSSPSKDSPSESVSATA